MLIMNELINIYLKKRWKEKLELKKENSVYKLQRKNKSI